MTTQIINFNEPFEKFQQWFNEACNDQRITEPTAMSLATVSLNNCPANRMVLLKKFDERGFCFFTNLNSRKAQEILANSNVSLCFYWGVLSKQIRIEGVAQKVSDLEADDYFKSRARQSQIGAWASKQSSTMNQWSEFEERISYFEEMFRDKDVERPVFWSGFRVVPRVIEFWSEGKFRIHHRQSYELVGQGWHTKILYP